MKKLALLGTMLLTTLSYAQFNIQFENTRFGIGAGANYSGVRNAHNPSGKRLGFQAGVLAQVPVDENNQFFIQQELQYYQAGETGYNKKERGNKNTKYYNNYISIPIYFKGYFSEAESEFFGMVGPRFNFLISQKVEMPSLKGYEIDNYGKASSFNFGIGAGVGFSYKRQWELALKYDLGLSNTYKDLSRYEAELKKSDPNSLKKKSEQVVSVTLNYIFD